MPEPPDDFAALVARARRGDEAAMAELLQRYAPQVLAVARVWLSRALRPYLDTVDVLQSVHLAMVRVVREEKANIASPEKLIGLALKVARRKVCKPWRKLQRQKRLSGSGEAPTGNLYHLLESLCSPEEDPARVAQFNDQLRHLCDNLDDTNRRILQLRLQGYTSKEIAKDLGLSPIAVRVRMNRLRKRLKAIGGLTALL